MPIETLEFEEPIALLLKEIETLELQPRTDARDRGCTWIVTETGDDVPDKPNPSFHNMIRSGFKVAYQRPNYMPPKQ